MTHADTEQRNTLIRQDYINGVIRPEIRRKYNVSNATIGYAVKGLSRKRTNYAMVKRYDIDEIIKFHNEGLNHFEISERLGATPRYIADLIRAKGIKPHRIQRKRKLKNKKEIPIFIREELPPRLEAIRQRYKNMEIINESNQTMRIRQEDLPFNVRPTSHKRNYSQVIFR